MTIDALPTAPNRNMTPEAFVAAADAFVASLSNMVTQVNADLNLILNLSGLLSTSSTSVAIGTGSKSLTVETNKAYLAGQSVRVYSTASPTNYMVGTVTSYNAGTGALVVNVTSVGGSGTLAAWTVVLAASGEWLGNATSVTGSAVVTGAISSSSPSAGIGYATGAGGEVTQLTSITTAVTLNKRCGIITTVSHSFVSGTPVEFELINSTYDGNDSLLLDATYGGDPNAGPFLLGSRIDQTGKKLITVYPLFTATTTLKITFSLFSLVAA